MYIPDPIEGTGIDVNVGSYLAVGIPLDDTGPCPTPDPAADQHEIKQFPSLHSRMLILEDFKSIPEFIRGPLSSPYSMNVE